MSKERRSLIDGLKATPEVQDLEEAFVFGAKKKPESTPAVHAQPIEVARGPEQGIAPIHDRGILPQMTGRIPVTTRCRPEVASALKRASLQRQLAGVEPYYVQDIMEEALEAWLGDKGYI